MSLLTQALVGVLIAAPAAFAESQTLTLVISPEALESNPTLEEMKRETARLVSPAEYSFAWLPKGQAVLGDSFEQLVVVRFRGACRSRAENEPASMEAGSLAATAVSGGQVLPFVQVDCDRTPADLVGDRRIARRRAGCSVRTRARPRVGPRTLPCAGPDHGPQGAWRFEAVFPFGRSGFHALPVRRRELGADASGCGVGGGATCGTRCRRRRRWRRTIAVYQCVSEPSLRK